MLRHVLKVMIYWKSIEEWMLERLLQRQPGRRVVLQHPSHQVQHPALLLARHRRRTQPPVLWQRPTVLGGVLGGRRRPVPGQLAVLEVVGLGPADEVVGDVAEYPAHHRQVLQVVVRLEQRVTLKKETFNV